ncbi:uncharacterized protein [Paramisgurnus dabryanus]|uniref:uncharacterized protein n=1 Tax=Paramisgurnus dabryanus TaxID=90735 RepID=UPI0031F464C5
MASTLQSAQEFLKKGRTLLTTSILNRDPVFEGLNECKFFMNYELDLVNSAADRWESLLDIVISKGEEACYTFLKILDKTRFEVFPRPGLQYPDLHHWISCFSFQDEPQPQSSSKPDTDPCTAYQGLLRLKARQILDDKWNQSMNFLKNEPKRKPFKYIPLVLDTDSSTVTKLKKTKEHKSRWKNLKICIPTDRKMLSPKHLLMNDEKTILLVGKPGVGKTTVALEILRLWIEEKSIQVSYMFYFDEALMRNVSQSPLPQTLNDLLFNHYICPNEASNEVLENIERNSENVVLIFDGIIDVIDNSVIKHLMDKELLMDAKVLTTCRPEAEDEGYLSVWSSYRVEVLGFNHESIHEYFKWMLGTEADSGVCALDNLELFSLCSVPLYAFIVTACILISPTETRNKSFTITEMYVRIFRFCMKQHGNKDVEQLDEYITDNKKDIVFLAQASYHAMLAKTVNLTHLDHTHRSVQNAFLSRNPSAPSLKVSAFLHNTMQEFWVALFLILYPENIPQVLTQCQSDEEGKYLKYIIPFLSGLLSDPLVEYIKCLVPVEQIQPTRTEYFPQIIDTFLYTKELNQEGVGEQFVEADNILFVCRCLYEYQSPEACQHFLNKVHCELDLQDQDLDPYQCCVVSYVVSHSKNHTVHLDLTNCNIPDHGLKLILGSLNKLKSLRPSCKSQMWRVAFETEQFSDFDSLFRLFKFEMHFNVHEKQDQKVFQKMRELLKQKRSETVHLYLHVNEDKITRSLQQTIFESLPNIGTIRIFPSYMKLAIESELFLQGAMYEIKTSQRCIRNLLSVLSSNERENFEDQRDFLLKLHAHAKNMDACAALQPVFHALPPVWVVKFSNTSMSLLLQIMKALNLKKPADLDVTYEQGELKRFLQCMPYITEIRFSSALRQPEDILKIVKIVADLFIFASESGEETLSSLSAACSYQTFPFVQDTKDVQSFFFLDLFAQLRKSSAWEMVLPALEPIFKVAPAIWKLDLSKLQKTFPLNDLLKLGSIQKTVELRSWSFDKDQLKSFLNCLHYISYLSCAEEFFQAVCEIVSVDREWNPKQVTELLRLLGFNISLTEMLPRRLCKAVESVFDLLDDENVSLSLLPKSISCHGSAFLFSNVKRLQTLRVNEIATSKLARLVKSAKSGTKPITVEKLSLVLSSSSLPEKALCQLLSSLNVLLSVWTVHNLDVSEFKIEAYLFISLLSLQSPLSIRFHEDTLQQLADIVYDAQDENLTQLFLEKIDRDLSTCNLSWDVLYYLIKGSKKKVTLDLPEGRFNVSNIPSLLTVLDTVRFKRISPRFVRAALREIYQKRAGHLIVKLLQSSADLINLCMRELDSTDCKALCFALHYSDGVKLNLLNSVIPSNETESIVKLLHRVSDLRIDRKLMLNFLRVSKDMEKQGYPTSPLLTTLNHKLDFSCHSSISSGRFTLSVMDCMAISCAIETSECDTELILDDCKADDSALEILFPILHKVHLRLGKDLLCQFLTLILNAPMAMSLKWASSLSKALGKQLDLSDTPVNYRTCESLQLVLDYVEELTHLKLSHCQITDACLDLLTPYLHKIMTLDVSGNEITDKGLQRLCSTLEGNSFTKTICLCDNQITETGLLVEEVRFVTLHAGTKTCAQHQSYMTKDLTLKSKMEKTHKTCFKREDHVMEFEPELEVNKGKIFYRFQCNTGGLFMCKATGLVFGMKGSGCVEYSVAHWDKRILMGTHYEPAGPLFDIKTPAGQMYELHLPHCETKVDEIGKLSVVHTHEDKPEFMTPVRITKTHIAVNICRLSRYGIVDEKDRDRKMISGQVLLFLEPDVSDRQQRIWVFLLPSNVPLLEIKEQQQDYEFIQTSSNCKLWLNEKYTLISKQAERVQPKECLFESLHAGNHHPTFEVFLDKCVTELRIKIIHKLKKNDSILFKNAWKRWIILKAKKDNCKQITSEELVINHGNTDCNSLQKWKSDLRDILEDLSKEELKKLKHLMRNSENRDSIPVSKLEKTKKDRYKLVNLIVQSWGFKESVKATNEFMNKLPRRDDLVKGLLEPHLKQFGLPD